MRERADVQVVFGAAGVAGTPPTGGIQHPQGGRLRRRQRAVRSVRADLPDLLRGGNGGRGVILEDADGDQ